MMIQMNLQYRVCQNFERKGIWQQGNLCIQFLSQLEAMRVVKSNARVATEFLKYVYNFYVVLVESFAAPCTGVLSSDLLVLDAGISPSKVISVSFNPLSAPSPFVCRSPSTVPTDTDAVHSQERIPKQSSGTVCPVFLCQID